MAEEAKTGTAGPIKTGSIKTLLDRFTPAQKMVLVTTIAITLAVIFVVVNITTSTRYGVLFSNLSARDSGRILEELKTRKVTYRLGGGGSIIKVPEKRIAELRLELAAGGLPEGGGVGFELFDKSSLTTTDFVQNINYIRAIEGELARTISQLREVRAARVHITLPRRSVFIEEQEEAKASIVLDLRPGAQISGSLVTAILHLTAQSVEGLKPVNIAVVDVTGALLSRPRGDADDPFGELSTTQLGYLKQVENNLSRKVIRLLEPYVGLNKVRADVKVKINFDKVETTEETVDPDRVARVSEKLETSSTTGTAPVGGSPGTSSNVAGLPDLTGPRPGRSAPKSRTEKSLINYEVSKKITHSTRPVGEILGLSLAVVVDDAQDVELQGDRMIRRPRRRTTQELDAIKKIAMAAVGFSAARGDVIEVANLPFDTSTETESRFYQEKDSARDILESLGPVGKYVLYALLFAALILLFFLLARKASVILKEILRPGSDNAGAMDAEKIAAMRDAGMDAEIEQELLEKYKVPKSTRKMNMVRQKVKRFVQENPDEASGLVKGLLVED